MTSLETVGRTMCVLLVLTLTHLATATPTSEAHPAGEPAEPEATTLLGDVITDLEERAETVENGGDSLVAFHRENVVPLIEALEARTDASHEQIERAALALVREGHDAGVDPRLLAAVLLVENPWLDPNAESSAGAIGLMQVMPFHAGNWGCGGSDLTDPEINICHGTKILAELLRRTRGDLDKALLSYNGCVRGTHTPDCFAYPQWVYGRAGPAWMSEIDVNRGALVTRRTATPTS